ncbi:MAG: vanadium-dependent haloperoxidase [Bacteroidota bacterium]
MKKIILFSLLACAAQFWIGCGSKQKDEPTFKTADFSAQLANDWFSLTLQITKETSGFTPPVAARSFGYTGLTLYEAVVGGMPEYRSLQGHLNGLVADALPAPVANQTYHWGICANRALAYLTANLYKMASAENLAKITALEKQYEAQFSADVSTDVFDRSKDYGEAIGKAMYVYAQGDGQSDAYTSNYPASYVVPKFAGAWVPTPPAYQPIPMQPYWGSVRTFAGGSMENSQPPAHPSYSTSPLSVFYAQALEVYTVTSNLTDEQTKIAQFWSDEPGKTATPPGHSISILKQVLDAKKSDLAVAAEAYAKVGMGLHDAFVSCWKCKYDFNLLRPISYIRERIDPSYNSLLTTPPFPEFTSGHSVQSGATAQILSELFGYNVGFTDQTHVGRTDIDGSPRHFDSFFDAANEAAISRLYGGIHYRAGIELGLEQGVQVGKMVSALPFRK